ncbi:unnamed protein product [Closterium sp. Yama58-4]|nr:unnamed protein product [Closterium sp. Yama58-4]
MRQPLMPAWSPVRSSLANAVMLGWLGLGQVQPEFYADEYSPEVDLSGLPDGEEASELLSCDVWKEPLPLGSERLRALLRINNFRDELRALRHHFLGTRELRVVTATWNVAGISDPPSHLDLTDWLLLQQPADIIAIGFQEIVPLSTGSVLGMDSEEAVGQWEALVRRQLNTAAAKAARKAAAKAASTGSIKGDEPTAGKTDGAEQAGTDRGSRAGDDETNSASSSSGVQGRSTPPPSLTSSSDLSFHSSSFRLPSSASDASKGSLDDGAAAAASLSPADAGAAAPGTPEWEGGALQQGEHANKASLDKISPEDLISVPLTPAEPAFADGGGYGGEGGGDGREERGDVRASEGGVEGKMVGVYLMVWARKGLRRHIHSVKASTVGCGLMGILGNKGSVAISMSVHETQFTFICAHLNAGEERADAARRTFDFLEILRRTAFPRELPDPWTARLAETITEHDRVFFFGDLNYRLELPDQEARALLAKRDWEALLQHDQLRWELSEGGALPGWREGPIFFAPTYKYAAGSNRYVGEDEEDGEKRRTPAWCDRVLWYDSGDATDSLPPTSISSPSPSSNTTTTGITSSGSMSRSVGGYMSDALQLVSYSRAELALSDHRPVAAVFAVQVEAVERERFDAAVAVACRQLDERQQLAIPHCSLSAHAVEFGEVPYASVIRRTIELHNLGTVPARFSVAPAGSTDTSAPGPAGGCGAWVVAEPAAGAVAPGHTVTLSLHTWVAVPGTRVDLLVDRGGLLDLILVVAIAGGGDLFVACSGSYVPSCWGLRLEALAGLKDPIRSLSLDAIATRQRSSLRHTLPTPAAAAGHQASIPEASETDPDNDDNNDSAAADGEDDRPLGAAARAAASPASDAFEVPKEVARMLTFLLDSGQDISSAFDPIALGIDLSLDQEDTTRFLAAKAAALGAVAQELQIAPIRLALDTGTPFPTETSPLTMARALVSFLLALPEPIIPPSVGEEVACREGWARGAAATLLAERLGAAQLGVVDSLLALIQALLRNRIANRLAIHELAAILAYCLFGPVPAFTNDEMGIATATDAVRIVKRRRRFMRLLIEDTRLRSK